MPTNAHCSKKTSSVRADTDHQRRPKATRQTQTVTVDPTVTRDIVGKDGVVVKAIQRMCRDGCRINRSIHADGTKIPGSFVVSAYTKSAVAAAKLFLERKEQEILASRGARKQRSTHVKPQEPAGAGSGGRYAALDDSDEEAEEAEVPRAPLNLGDGAWIGKKGGDLADYTCLEPNPPSKTQPPNSHVASRTVSTIRTGFRMENDIRSRRSKHRQERQERERSQATAYQQYLTAWKPSEKDGSPLDEATYRKHHPHRPAPKPTKKPVKTQPNPADFQHSQGNFPALSDKTGTQTASAWTMGGGLEKVRASRPATPPVQPPRPKLMTPMGDSWGDDDGDSPGGFTFADHSVENWEETDWA
jgi:hypothetical protein